MNTNTSRDDLGLGLHWVFIGLSKDHKALLGNTKDPLNDIASLGVSQIEWLLVGCWPVLAMSKYCKPFLINLNIPETTGLPLPEVVSNSTEWHQ
jgi:hypothetical protein